MTTLADSKDRKIVNSGTTKDGSQFVVKKDLPAVRGQQSKFDEILNKFKTFSLTSSSQTDDILTDMDDKISANTFAYLNKMKSTTGDDITRFLNKTIQQSSNVTNSMMGIKTAEDLFNNDSNNFGAFFFERYKNINNKYEDLRIITEYLYELTEAVTTMRDNIINADDLVSMISREIHFGDKSKETQQSSAVSAVEKMEDKYQLKEKLKNIIIPGTLTYGNFFVYTIPYRDIFAQFEYRKKLDMERGVARESYDIFDHPVLENSMVVSNNKSKKADIHPVVENLTALMNSIDGSKKYTSEAISKDLNYILEGIDISNNDVTPFLEDANLLAMADDEVRNQALKAYRDASRSKGKAFWERNTSSDAVVDTGEVDPESTKEYKDIPDVFIKLYSPERVIPVYVMDACVGYYVLYETYGEIRNSILLNSSLNRTNLAFASAKRKELDDEVINVIAKAICNSIDKKYVTQNPKFKELIVNAISYEDFYKKKFKVQFIPAQYMRHFKVNEDPDNHMGVSVLNKSLFYAKLYLSLLLFKIITILTKSNDMRVYYIRNAGIKKDMVNRIQDIARSIKDKQISFNDLASIQTIFSKVGAYKEAFIPMGKSGEKNIEFDILSGQDVQLNTDLMEMLRKGMINNSGVPSVILSYMEEADFARTLTMQHAKYMARIIAIQTELERTVTDWYKDILRFDQSLQSTEQIDSLTFNFTRPKTLNAQDMSDLISNAENLADFVTKMIVDENDSELTAAYKQHLVKNNFLAGVFNWKELDDAKKDVILKLKLEKEEKELAGGGGES